MFNYQIWTKQKFWIFTGIVFVLGMLFPLRTIEKKTETVREVPVEKRVEVVKEVLAQCNFSDWQKLKAIDDQGFNYCTIALELTSQGFTAVSRQDYNQLKKITAQMTVNNQNISEATLERQTLLDKLGY